MLVSAGMAAAYGPKGVRVNVVNPAQTVTERLREGMLADARLHGITPEEAMERATARACRAATLLKRACAAQVEGGAA